MKEMNSVIIYKSYVEMMNTLLTNDSDWKEAMSGLLKYGFEGVVPTTDNPIINAVYSVACPLIKRARENYINKVEASNN